MSDFTDDEDRQLVQLAAVMSAHGTPIPWDRLAARMVGSTHSRLALRQRLKTLKRTHGRDLHAFPSWYFRKPISSKRSNERSSSDAVNAACARPTHTDSNARLQDKRVFLPPLSHVHRTRLRQDARRFTMRVNMKCECRQSSFLRPEVVDTTPALDSTQSPIESVVYHQHANNRCCCDLQSSSVQSMCECLQPSSLELLAAVADDARSGSVC